MKIFPKGFIEKCTRTVGDKNEIDEIMRFTIFLQRVFGIQILDPHWTWKRSFPHQLATGLLLLYITIGTLDIVSKTNDVRLVAEAAYTGIIVICFASRFYFFLMTRNDFQKAYVHLKTTLYKSIKDDSEEKFKDVLRKTRFGVNFMLTNTCFLPVVIYFLSALWCNIVNGEKVTMSRTTSILMPMRSPYYELGLLLHSIFMIEAAFIVIFVEMLWFLVMMVFFCTSCDSTVKLLAVEEKENESQLQYATRLNSSLRKFYRSHVKEIEFLGTLNAMYKWLALMPLISVSCCICIILLVMSKGLDLRFVSNVIPTMVELFVYNWFGDQIKRKAENWKTALLEFDWLNLPLKDKKCYYIMVCFVQKEFGIKTAIGTDLSLVTMSNALKFSYQAFTVLQSVEA